MSLKLKLHIPHIPERRKVSPGGENMSQHL